MLVGLVTVAFMLVHLAPGDPIVALSGEFATADYRRRIEALYGLDQPIIDQYFTYIANVFRGELGQSYYYKSPVLDVVLGRLPATLMLVVPAIILSSLFGVWLGVVMSERPDSARSTLITSVLLSTNAIPVFWLGQLLMLSLAIGLDLFPIQGFRNLRYEYSGWRLWIDVGHHLVLPLATITLHQIAFVAVLARARLEDEMRKPYILTAKTKGLSVRQAQIRHGLRNSMLPVVTMIGNRFGSVLVGATLTENVFGWPGLGRLLVTASLNRDFPLILGLFLGISFVTIVANLLTDLSYMLIDPRTRKKGAIRA